MHPIRRDHRSTYVQLSMPRPDLLPLRIHVPCCSFSRGPQEPGFQKASLFRKDQDKESFQYLSLFPVLCNDVPLVVQQWAHIFHGLPLVTSVLTEALLVIFDVPDQTQFHLDFRFPNFIPGCSHDFSAFLPRLPVLASIPCTLPFCEFGHFCPTSCTLGWTMLDHGADL